MDQLINDSLKLIKIDDNLNSIYNWMDYGDVLNNKIRSKTSLSGIELNLILKLKNIIKQVTLKENVYLYRGMNMDLTKLTFLNAEQFNSLTDKIETAITYGSSIMYIMVPKGTNAFYVSAWEDLNPNIEKDEEKEKEILLLPGNFIPTSQAEYLYENILIRNFTYQQI